MGAIAGMLLLFALWGVPIAVVVYIVRALTVIIEGQRSINAAVQRIAAATEAMASASRSEAAASDER